MSLIIWMLLKHQIICYIQLNPMILKHHIICYIQLDRIKYCRSLDFTDQVVGTLHTLYTVNKWFARADSMDFSNEIVRTLNTPAHYSNGFKETPKKIWSPLMQRILRWCEESLYMWAMFRAGVTQCLKIDLCCSSVCKWAASEFSKLQVLLYWQGCGPYTWNTGPSKRKPRAISHRKQPGGQEKLCAFLLTQQHPSDATNSSTLYADRQCFGKESHSTAPTLTPFNKPLQPLKSTGLAGQ